MIVQHVIGRADLTTWWLLKANVENRVNEPNSYFIWELSRLEHHYVVWRGSFVFLK